MASENGQEKRDTMADIVAEYRNDADAMDRGELYQPTTEYLRRLLDRIEAIDSADAWRSLYAPPVGNAAALREALVALTEEVMFYLRKGLIQLPLPIEKSVAKSIAALSAPPRNCNEYDCKSDAEVGFVEQTGETDANPLYWQLFANWLFAPAAERKGDGNAE